MLGIACHQQHWLQLLRSCLPEGELSCPGVVVERNWAAAANSRSCQLSALPPSANPTPNSIQCIAHFNSPPQESS
jgi:hypothetical protein